jgi:hypothetical protein
MLSALLFFFLKVGNDSVDQVKIGQEKTKKSI